MDSKVADTMPPADFGYSLASREPKAETIPPEISLGRQRQEGNGRSPSPEVLSDQRPPCPYPAHSGLLLPTIPISGLSPNFLQHPHMGCGKWGGERKEERVSKSQQQKQNKTTKTTTTTTKNKTEIKIKNQEIQMGKRKRQKEKTLKCRKEKEN